MEERKRLGRGLEDVSRFYLTSRPGDASEKTRKPDALPVRRHIVRVFYPGSVLIKACFIANLALELARNRFHVDIWDGDRSEGICVEAMLRQVVRQGPYPGAGIVRLYGLPDILVHNAEDQSEGKLGELKESSCPERERFLLVSSPDSIGSVLGWDDAFDAILLTPVEGASLLRCYAYCKVIWERDPSSRVHIAFDDPGSEIQVQETFSRFSGFVKERLSGDPHFLGCLVHDGLLESSIAERKPLVLYHEASAAKDSLLEMSASFMESRRGHAPASGGV